MVQKDGWERKLAIAIDALVGEMNMRYTTELNEEQEIERKMQDIRLRDELIEHIAQLLMCRKISERAMQETNTSVVYELHGEISSERLNLQIAHKRISRANEP